MIFPLWQYQFSNMMKNNMRIVYIFAVALVLGGIYFLRGGGTAPAPAVVVAPAVQEETSAVSADAAPALQALAEAVKTPEKVRAVMKTNLGDIALELFPKDAPKTVENFMRLAQAGFYNGVKFHRVIKGFMAQTGDPKSKDNDWSDDGTGGPGYTFADEINAHKLVRGALAMANAGLDTNGSQFFIVTAAATPWLDGKHTVFGRVAGGMDIVDRIENTPVDHVQGDHPTRDIVINSVEITAQ